MPPKSTSPLKPSAPRGRPRTKPIDAKTGKPASKARSISTGSKPRVSAAGSKESTPANPKRKSTPGRRSRSQSKASRPQSVSRKSEPRQRSVSRKSATRKSEPQKSSKSEISKIEVLKTAKSDFSKSGKFEVQKGRKSGAELTLARSESEIIKPSTSSKTASYVSRDSDSFERDRSPDVVFRQRRSIAATRESTTSDHKLGTPLTSSLLPGSSGDKPITRASLAASYAKASSSKSSKASDWVHQLGSSIKQFGYGRTIAAAFWITALPAYVFALHLQCSREHCYIRFNPTIPKTLRVYADPVVLSYGAALIALQCILSALPIGRVVTGFGYRRSGSFQHRSNSFMCLVLSTALYCVAVFYLQLPNTRILQSHRFKCVSAATILSFVISLLLYVKSFVVGRASHRNYGSSCSPGVQGNHLHDFVHGREISPRIGRTFDLGFILLRTGNIIWVLAVLSGCLQARGSGPVFGLSYSVATVAAMQLVYVFLGSFNETYLLKSAFIQQGVGFLFTFSAIVLAPFCGSLPLRFLVDGKPANLSFYFYPALLILFAVGMFLIHYSNSLKYNNARVGGKTLRSGPWALVRHPNYLGEILCALAWSIPCGKTLLPYAHLIFITLITVLRSLRTERYTNADYRNYQQQVRYRILPFIF